MPGMPSGDGFGAGYAHENEHEYEEGERDIELSSREGINNPGATG